MLSVDGCCSGRIELEVLKVSLAVRKLFQVKSSEASILTIRFCVVQAALSFTLATLNYPFLYKLKDVLG